MNRGKNKGFTLVELIIVIAVVAVLIAVLVPTLTSVINKANRSAFEQDAANVYKEAALDKVAEGKADYHAYYTDGKNCMAFNSLNEKVNLGKFDAATNTFDGDKSKNFCFDLTNDGYLILIHKAGGNLNAATVEGDVAADNVVAYSCVTSEGEDALINAANYHPTFFAYDSNGVVTATYKASKYGAGIGQLSTALKNKYQQLYQPSNNVLLANRNINTNIYTENLPHVILNAAVTLPSKIAALEVKNVSTLTSIYGGLTQIEKLTVEEGVIALNSSFSAATQLSDLSLPQSLTSLSSSAFTSCASLTSVYLPPNIEFGTSKYFNKDTKLILKDNLCKSAVTLKNSSNESKVEHSNTLTFTSAKEALQKGDAIDVYFHFQEAAYSNKILEFDAEEISAQKSFTATYNVNKPVTEFSTSTTKSTKLLPDDAKTLTLKLTTDLIVRGEMQIGAVRNTKSQGIQGHISGDYVELDLNGHTLTVAKGGFVMAAGLITDSSPAKTGNIIIEDGGVLKTSFVVLDFNGGSLSFGRYSGDVTPFNRYCVPYLKCKVRINNGGNLTGLCVLYAITYNATEQVIVGEGGLIETTSPDSYVIKSYNEGIETLEIFGNAKMNALSLKISVIFATYEVTTAKAFFPIPSGIKIIIKKDCEFTLSNMIKVLPGGAIITEEGSKVIFDKKTIQYMDVSTLKYLSCDIAGKITVYDKYENCSNPDHASGVTCSMKHDICKYPQDLMPGLLEINGDIEFKNNSITENYALVGNIRVKNIEKYKNIIQTNKEMLDLEFKTREGGSTGSNTAAQFAECYTVTNKTTLVTEDKTDTAITYSSYTFDETNNNWVAAVKTYNKAAAAETWTYTDTNITQEYSLAGDIWTRTVTDASGTVTITFKIVGGNFIYLTMTDSSGTYRYQEDIGKWVK